MGFFDEAGIDVNEVPDDPYGFGNLFWPVFVVEVKEPKVTANGDKYGAMVVWAVDDPKFEGQQVSQNLGFGNWLQLPPPSALGIPFDPKNDEKDKRAIFQLGTILKALGFKADEMGSVGPDEMKGRRCAAKIRVELQENGFWSFNPYGFRQLKDGDGSAGNSSNGEGSTHSAPASQSGKSAEELLADELNNA